MKQLFLWVFYGVFAFAHHLVNEPSEHWTGQVNLSDDGSDEFLQVDVEPRRRWRRSRDWGDRDGHRRRWRRGHDWSDDDGWDHRDWSGDHWNGQDWSDNGDWNKQDWSNDTSMNDEILDGDANCVKCPQVLPICKCPARQHCQYIKRTCNRCAHYICRK